MDARLGIFVIVIALQQPIMSEKIPSQDPPSRQDQAPGKSSDKPEIGLKERFFLHYKHEVNALQERIEGLKTTSWSGGERNDAIEHCLAGIDRLSQEVKDAASYLPAYDVRSFSDGVKGLSASLQTVRAEFAPPKKFQFKTGRKNSSAISLSDAAELAQQQSLHVPGGRSTDTSNANSSFSPTPLEKLSPSEEKQELEYEITQKQEQSQFLQPPPPVPPRSSNISISSHNSKHIQLPASVNHAACSASVTNLRHSVVDLCPPTSTKTYSGAPFATLTLKNIRDSLVVCGRVTGPTHITDVTSSTIVVAAGQFRMHGSKDVDVYLWCGSRPIIEDCEGIRFFPLPENYVTEEIPAGKNQYDQIDDFKWLKQEPSPNFKVLGSEKGLGDQVWREVVPGGCSIGVVDILEAVKRV